MLPSSYSREQRRHYAPRSPVLTLRSPRRERRGLPSRAADETVSQFARVITPRRTADFPRSYSRLRTTFPCGSLLARAYAHQGLVLRRFTPVRCGCSHRRVSPGRPGMRRPPEAPPLALLVSAGRVPYARLPDSRPVQGTDATIESPTSAPPELASAVAPPARFRRYPPAGPCVLDLSSELSRTHAQAAAVVRARTGGCRDPDEHAPANAIHSTTRSAPWTCASTLRRSLAGSRISPDPPNPRPDSAAGTRKQVPL